MVHYLYILLSTVWGTIFSVGSNTFIGAGCVVNKDVS